MGHTEEEHAAKVLINALTQLPSIHLTETIEDIANAPSPAVVKCAYMQAFNGTSSVEDPNALRANLKQMLEIRDKPIT